MLAQRKVVDAVTTWQKKYLGEKKGGSLSSTADGASGTYAELAVEINAIGPIADTDMETH